MAEEPKRILVVAHHNAFREALAMRLNQEEDLEVALQAGSITGTCEVHLKRIDVAVVDPFLLDEGGLEFFASRKGAEKKMRIPLS